MKRLAMLLVFVSASIFVWGVPAVVSADIVPPICPEGCDVSVFGFCDCPKEVEKRVVADRERMARDRETFPRQYFPKVVVGESDISDNADVEGVKEVIEARSERLLNCFSRSAHRRQLLTGRIVVSWVIALDGSVAELSLMESDFDNEAVEECFEYHLGQWRFEAPADEEVQVRSTIEFLEPGDEDDTSSTLNLDDSEDGDFVAKNAGVISLGSVLFGICGIGIGFVSLRRRREECL